MAGRGTAAIGWVGASEASGRAVAATTLDAEVLAKTAMLSGPDRARTLLGRRGGVLQHEDGRVEIVAGMPTVRLRRPVREACA